MDIAREMPTDLAEAVVKVVREGRQYGVTVVIRSEGGGQHVVESIDVESERAEQ